MGRIVTIIGTRPEIIKMAPVVKALDALDHEHVLVHSGQHYDVMMDRIFFRDLELREPDHQFELKARPPHLQVATTMRQVAPVAKDADLVIIHGDTNTTLAGGLLASKQGRPLAHVEAGIRSFDKTMPEEVNRIIADQLSNLLFTPTPTSRENLRRENVTEGVHVVGNSVIDALLQNRAIAEKRSDVLSRLGLKAGGYLLLTFHRAEAGNAGSRIERPAGDGSGTGRRCGPSAARRGSQLAESIRGRYDWVAGRGDRGGLSGTTWPLGSSSCGRRAPRAWSRASPRRP